MLLGVEWPPIIPFLGDAPLAQILVDELGDLRKYLLCLRLVRVEKRLSTAGTGHRFKIRSENTVISK